MLDKPGLEPSIAIGATPNAMVYEGENEVLAS